MHSTRHWIVLVAGTCQSMDLSDEACHKLGKISPVMQCFVIYRPAACRIGSSLNAKDRGPWLDFQRCSDLDPGWHCVQLVLRLNQRNIVFAFEECKDRLNSQIVDDDLFAYVQRQVGLVEG